MSFFFLTFFFSKSRLSKVFLLPDDLKPKERMSKNWPLQVRVNNQIIIDANVDNHDITAGQYVFRQFLFSGGSGGSQLCLFLSDKSGEAGSSQSA